MNDYQPRLDEHGVGWCHPRCPLYDISDEEYGEQIQCDQCSGLVCPYWAKDAARDRAAMEAIRKVGHDYGLRRLMKGDDTVWCAYTSAGACEISHDDADPATAILAAKEASQ